MRMHPSVLDKAGFGKSPKALDLIDMGLAGSELILSMIDSQVLSITDINQAVIAAPAVGVDDAVKADLSPNNRLQSGLGAIGDYLGVHAAIALEDAKDDGFAVGSSSPLALYATSPKERFVNFDLPAERGPGVAEHGQTHSKGSEITINRVAAQTHQGGDLRGVEINRKQAHQLPEFAF